MIKAILMMAVILSSASVFADIKWQVTGDEKGERVEKIRLITIQMQELHIHTTDDQIYVITNEVIQRTGLSIKELRDLLKEYDTSKDEVLIFNASSTFTSGANFVRFIGALVLGPKDQLMGSE